MIEEKPSVKLSKILTNQVENPTEGFEDALVDTLESLFDSTELETLVLIFTHYKSPVWEKFMRLTSEIVKQTSIRLIDARAEEEKQKIIVKMQNIMEYKH